MRRSFVARALSTAFALWFAAVLGDPGVLHACPEHGAHAGHAAHATHQMAGGDHGAPAQHKGCTCVGSCCAAPVIAPLPEIATFAVSTRIIPAVAQQEPSPDAPAPKAYRLLPFANGPPQG